MAGAIAVENLSKKYIIGHQARERYTALRDVLANGAKRFVHKLAHPFAEPEDDATHETFWALKDINFNIEQGDRVGIIGRNGAGKSTLLKILSRITEPTSGRIKIRGRVSSLLEVGTGFHPELTGRENIFLNGAILGMGKAEITRKFDEIVAFAEVEKFLDTPVKRYSSGMYVRLAFAVAAHLEPEILIVDEVLAVGDAQFQKKCLGKMEDVGKEGRTVLFVSHNMASIQQLCSRGILLKKGAVANVGPIEKAVDLYLHDAPTGNDGRILDDVSRSNKDFGTVVRFVDLWPVDAKGDRITGFRVGEEIALHLEIKAFEKIDDLSVVVGLDNYMGYRLGTVLSEEVGALFAAEKGSTMSLNLRFPHLKLKPGTYALTLGIRRKRLPLDHVVGAVGFEVREVSADGMSYDSVKLGDMLIEPVWQLS